jgi:hypothetical protein
MRICCQLSAIIGEFNKIIFPSNYSNGFLMEGFIDNLGLSYMEMLVKWMVQTTYLMEIEKIAKSVEVCRHIQLLWSHIIDFYY